MFTNSSFIDIYLKDKIVFMIILKLKVLNVIAWLELLELLCIILSEVGI